MKGDEHFGQRGGALPPPLPPIRLLVRLASVTRGETLATLIILGLEKVGALLEYKDSSSDSHSFGAFRSSCLEYDGWKKCPASNSNNVEI